MTGSDDEVTPAGWYRQSEDPGHLRWWDGEDWTDDRMPLPAGYGKAAPRGAAKAAPAAAPPPIRIERAAEGGVRTTGARPTGARGAGSRPASAKPAPAVGGRTRKAPAKRMSRPTDSARPAERS